MGRLDNKHRYFFDRYLTTVWHSDTDSNEDISGKDTPLATHRFWTTHCYDDISVCEGRCGGRVS